MNEIGIFLIDKPAGITSFDVIRKLRRITGIRKMGHSGTLDPFATGLLAVCVGKATRVAEWIGSERKTYQARIKLGERTDTGDSNGKIIEIRSVPPDLTAKIAAAEIEMLKIKEQIPPRFSAKKIDGKKAYDLARQNIDFTLPANSVKIYDFTTGEIDPSFLSYRTTVSKGTYIRTLSETFAEMLGTTAKTIELRRTKVGKLLIVDCVPLDELTVENWQNYLIPLTKIFTEIPQIKLSPAGIYLFRNGRKIDLRKEDMDKIIAIDREGNCLGFGKIAEKRLQPTMVLI